MKRNILLFLIILVSLSSCKVFQPNQMLRTGPNYPYAEFPREPIREDYRIAPHDALSFYLATREGEKMISPLMEGAQGQQNTALGKLQQQSPSYLVEYDGMVKLPVLGRVQVSGMTIREAEKYLEKQFEKYYNQPFVQLRVQNMRVTVFSGGNSSQVVILENPNTTLFEVLAQTGGVNDGKTHRIKLIRGEKTNPEVYIIDLSTIEGMKQADLVMQAGDIIYIQPRDRVAQRILENITPYLSLVSTALVIVSLLKN